MRFGSVDLVIGSFTNEVYTEGDEGNSKAQGGVTPVIRHHRVFRHSSRRLKNSPVDPKGFAIATLLLLRAWCRLQGGQFLGFDVLIGRIGLVRSAHF